MGLQLSDVLILNLNGVQEARDTERLDVCKTIYNTGFTPTLLR